MTQPIPPEQRTPDIPPSFPDPPETRGDDIAGKNAAIARLVQRLREAQAEIEHPQTSLLPEAVARELRTTGEIKPTVFEDVSVMFTDIVGFTGSTQRMPPEVLIGALDACFSAFDEVVERNGLLKIKNIGDCHMCAGGVPTVNRTHALDCVLSALEIRGRMERVNRERRAQNLPYWEIRIGIHTGSAIAGVVGRQRYTYDLWGDTVNTASRIEGAGVTGQVHVSEATWRRVEAYVEGEARGLVSLRGKGTLPTWFVTGLRPEYRAAEEAYLPNAALLATRTAG